MKICKLAIAILFIIMFSIFAYAISYDIKEEFVDSNLSSVKKIQDCYDTIIIEKENVMGVCDYSSSEIVCDKDMKCVNTSTTIQKECVTSTNEVETIKKVCSKPKGYLINDAVKLSTNDYACSNTEKDGKVTVVCDSKYDGNGDGICTSGESCQKFVIDGDNIQRYQKNSNIKFVKEDYSFYLNEASSEVLK